MKRFILGIFAFLLIANFNGCSSSGDAMTFSNDNIKELSQEMADVSKSIDPNTKQIDAFKAYYVDTLDDMGYSLDVTILEYIRYGNSKNRTQKLGVLINIFSPVEEFIIKNPKLVVDEDIVTEETVKKIQQYKKFMSFNKKL